MYDYCTCGNLPAIEERESSRDIPQPHMYARDHGKSDPNTNLPFVRVQYFYYGEIIKTYPKVKYIPEMIDMYVLSIYSNSVKHIW